MQKELTQYRKRVDQMECNSSASGSDSVTQDSRTSSLSSLNDNTAPSYQVLRKRTLKHEPWSRRAPTVHWRKPQILRSSKVSAQGRRGASKRSAPHRSENCHMRPFQHLVSCILMRFWSNAFDALRHACSVRLTYVFEHLLSFWQIA